MYGHASPESLDAALLFRPSQRRLSLSWNGSLPHSVTLANPPARLPSRPNRRPCQHFAAVGRALQPAAGWFHRMPSSPRRDSPRSHQAAAERGDSKASSKKRTSLSSDAFASLSDERGPLDHLRPRRHCRCPVGSGSAEWPQIHHRLPPAPPQHLSRDDEFWKALTASHCCCCCCSSKVCEKERNSAKQHHEANRRFLRLGRPFASHPRCCCRCSDQGYLSSFSSS